MAKLHSDVEIIEEEPDHATGVKAFEIDSNTGQADLTEDVFAAQPIQQATPTTEDSWPSSASILAAGPLIAWPPTIGETATTGETTQSALASTQRMPASGGVFASWASCAASAPPSSLPIPLQPVWPASLPPA